MAAFRDGAAEIAICGDLDLTTASTLDEMLSMVLDKQPRGLMLDLTGVEFMDCAAARIIARAAQSLPAGHELTIRSPGLAVRRMLELTGLLAAVAEDGRPLHRPGDGEPSGAGQPLRRHRSQMRS